MKQAAQLRPLRVGEATFCRQGLKVPSADERVGARRTQAGRPTFSSTRREALIPLTSQLSASTNQRSRVSHCLLRVLAACVWGACACGFRDVGSGEEIRARAAPDA